MKRYYYQEASRRWLEHIIVKEDEEITATYINNTSDHLDPKTEPDWYRAIAPRTMPDTVIEITEEEAETMLFIDCI